MYLNIHLFSPTVPEVFKKPNKFCNEFKPPLNYKNLLYIPSINILFCNIPKAASTNVRRIIHAHAFFNENNSSPQDNLKRGEVWSKLEKDFFDFYLQNDLKSQSIVNNRTLNVFKFMLARHPFRRIYSAFIDKFVHDHEDDALFGWREFQEEIIIQVYPNETILSLRRRDARLDFSTFLRYLVDTIRQQKPMNNHWDQIVTRCGFCYIDYDWVGKVENLKTDGPVLMRKLKHLSKQNLNFPSSQLDESNKDRKQLTDEGIVQLFRDTLNNETHFRLLIDYYKPDFLAFNYPLPDS